MILQAISRQKKPLMKADMNQNTATSKLDVNAGYILTEEVLKLADHGLGFIKNKIRGGLIMAEKKISL